MYRSYRTAHAGQFKESEGTGLGDGDTTDAKDVSNQIQDEDQIMGAQTKEQQEEEREKEAKEEAGGEEGPEEEGVDMQQDFDGEYDDMPKDEGQESDSEVRAERVLVFFGDFFHCFFCLCSVSCLE